MLLNFFFLRNFFYQILPPFRALIFATMSGCFHALFRINFFVVVENSINTSPQQWLLFLMIRKPVGVSDWRCQTPINRSTPFSGVRSRTYVKLFSRGRVLFLNLIMCQRCGPLKLMELNKPFIDPLFGVDWFLIDIG